MSDARCVDTAHPRKLRQGTCATMGKPRAPSHLLPLCDAQSLLPALCRGRSGNLGGFSDARDFEQTQVGRLPLAVTLSHVRKCNKLAVMIQALQRQPQLVVAYAGFRLLMMGVPYGDFSMHVNHAIHIAAVAAAAAVVALQAAMYYIAGSSHSYLSPAIGAPRDQKNCRTCVAYATAEAVEMALATAMKISRAQLVRKGLTTSPASLHYCTPGDLS